jgi:hypothetical protein
MVDPGTTRLAGHEAAVMTRRMASIPVVGRSMRPLLGPGVRVDIRPLATLPRPGAILVYTASDGIVVHRLMGVLRQAGELRLVTKGDASARYDPPIEPSRVLGEVVLARYRRLSLRVDNRICRRLGWILSSAAPFVHRIGRRLGHAS